MSAVPDQVLQWLHSNLKPQYRYVDRTYSDVAQVLIRHASLAPKTDVFTFDTGSSALLLVLYGTLPVQFRGVEYRYPVTIWLPHNYPQEPPMAYVTPTQEMAIRPGQHVSVEGRIYHPYLAQWASSGNSSILLALVDIVADIFAKEPPVVSRQQQQQGTNETSQARHGISSATQHDNQRPQTRASRQPIVPPKPPKTTAGAEPRSPLPRPASNNSRNQPILPPALPPKPDHIPSYNDTLQRLSISSDPSRFNRSDSLPRSMSRQQAPPAPPRQAYPGDRNAAAMFPQNGSNQGPQSQQYIPRRPPPSEYAPQSQRLQLYQSPRGSQQPVANQAAPNQHQHVSTNQPPQQKALKPAQDLMSSPLDVTLPSQTSAPMSAPPIPPNPEKDALLRAISQALVGQLTQTVSQNYAAIPDLEAQYAAMQQAHQNMTNELSQLQDLDKTLSSNEQILHATMRDADKQLESVRRKEKPNIDEVLIAPTVVGEQLYGLVADERAIGDAMFALTRALDKGRIAADVYIKQTRSLAREQFLKKALIKKIGQGMGLDPA